VDFSAGAFPRTEPEQITSRGVADLIDGLPGDDGSIFQRGGDEYFSNTGWGTSGLRFLWDGLLGPGQRTVLADTGDFAVLDGSNTPLDLSGAGMTVPKKGVEVGGVLFIPTHNLYAGSRKTAVYSAGTVTVTNGSKTVTGAGTSWSANVDAGMLFYIGGVNRVYAVEQVNSNTSLTLRDAYAGSTAAGITYSLSPLETGATVYRTGLYATAAGRLFSLENNRAYFTLADNPHVWPTTNYHELPQGARIVGGAGLGSRMLLFASNGLWTIDGLDFDLVNPFSGDQQHTVRYANPELLLLSHEGISAWQGRLVAPCMDGVWMADGISAPIKVSQSIDGLWREYVDAGYRTGISAVFNGHYLLPIINSSGVVQDQLVCRLDRLISTSNGDVRPWARLQGHGANVTAWASRTAAGEAPLLLGANASEARVTKHTALFSKTAARKNDANATAPALTIETRDFPAGDGFGDGTVKMVRVRYELTDAASDNPTMSAEYSADGGAWVALTGSAPEDDGTDPYTWRFIKKCRFIRFRFRVTAPNSKMVFRSIEMWSRPSQRRRSA
jgi:hypothetical protein